MADCVQEKHELVALLTTFSLFDRMYHPVVVFPQISIWPSVEKMNEGKSRRISWDIGKSFQHGPPGNEVERADTVQ